jgi:hypothetical protein
MEYNTLHNIKNSADTISQFLTPLNKGLASDELMNDTVRPGMYHLSERTMTKPECYFDYQNVSGNGQTTGSVVDLESELRGITQINSKCDNRQLKKPSVFKKSSNLQTVPYCSDFLTPTDSRQRKACKTSSEVLLNRFDFPLDDMLIQPNSYIGLNTRLSAKEQIEKQDQQNPFIKKRN